MIARLAARKFSEWALVLCGRSNESLDCSPLQQLAHVGKRQPVAALQREAQLFGLREALTAFQG